METQMSHDERKAQLDKLLEHVTNQVETFNPKYVESILWGDVANENNRMDLFLQQEWRYPRNRWYALRLAYMETNNLSRFRHILPVLLTDPVPYREQLMLPNERLILEKMPDEIELYRGTREFEYKADWSGVAWTTHFGIAQFFANDYQNRSEEEMATGPVILTCTIPKERVIAFFQVREEEEFIFVTDARDNIQLL